MLGCLVALVLAGCGLFSTPRQEGVTSSTDEVDTTRTVALGEEFLLGDLLALGVPVLASTVTTPSAGVQGLDRYDTSDIEVLPSTSRDLEPVLTLNPTLIVATDFVVAEVGRDRLEAVAPVVTVGVGDWRDVFSDLGAALDVPDTAAAALAEYDRLVRDGQRRIRRDDVGPVSVATVYPGEAIAVWGAGPSTVPGVLTDLGVELAPDGDDVELDENGRAFVSVEQMPELLSGETLMLLQSEAVEGESEALQATLDGPVLRAVPAVAADRVAVLDRLGYPGLPGRLEAVIDLQELLIG